MHDIERQIALPKLADKLFNHRIGIVATAALLIAERPQGRQRHVARKVCITAEDLFDRRSVEKVVVHLPAFGAKPCAQLRGAAKVEVASIGVIEKNSVSDAALQADVERNRLVDWILAFGVAGC